MDNVLYIFSLIVIFVSFVMATISFSYIFKNKKQTENDLNVIQRQLRGFALFSVSQLVAVFGLMLYTIAYYEKFFLIIYNKMSNTTISICSLIVMLASIAVTVISFMYIFQKKKQSENDLNVIQRQLRGFAMLTVSQLVSVFGLMLCAGTLIPMFLKTIEQ